MLMITIHGWLSGRSDIFLTTHRGPQIGRRDGFEGLTVRFPLRLGLESSILLLLTSAFYFSLFYLSSPFYVSSVLISGGSHVAEEYENILHAQICISRKLTNQQFPNSNYSVREP